MALIFFFIFDDLSVELINHEVDRGIHVFLNILGIQFRAADLHSGFSFLFEFLDSQNDMNIHHIIEMTFDFADFFLDIGFQRLGDFYVMACDTNLHGNTPDLKNCASRLD